MIELTDTQIDELRQLQKQTVEENPELKTILNKFNYINPINECPWVKNYDVGQYAKYIENPNYTAYNEYIGLSNHYNLS